jgi:hypothetical protein
MENLLNDAIPVALAAVALVLLMGLWNMMQGGSANRSQMLMRLRIMLQALALLIVMTVIYLRAK